MHLRALLFPPMLSNFFCTYSNKILMDHMIASMNEPKAKEPKLYLNDHHKPLKILKLPLELMVLVKYHWQTPTISMY